MTIEPDAVADLIEEHLSDAVARVTAPRIHDDEDEDAHFAAVVVSPAFEGESLVDQHQRVYDAVGDHMTRSVHALEIKTYTPEAYAEHGDGTLDDDLREAGLLPVDDA
ncbi:BolA family protein [Halorubrum distributum JCM 9100]|uniref:BolA family protein n=6 Tax=Halorubrum distributum TaxID=29283 RepID=M0EW15_9EURY|nr:MULTISPECIES: BolA family protein [Halorubrum distributum group]PHQ46308.1 BolA family transcriptional regulator [Halorubrum sp. C3]ELZ34696.1 BolA family protein [Halorubrum terrestre JCM 10247]ELZ51981.1 BolA family protein [Halorubrum distributum JCM 9100]ELZ52053.1 BolA family protein [Halorubrum distributum JCM 10118]EMA64187.1 BolA family protein [Halorubrum litoreum JCM 13561]